jgi:hypothetical protein
LKTYEWVKLGAALQKAKVLNRRVMEMGLSVSDGEVHGPGPVIETEDVD